MQKEHRVDAVQAGLLLCQLFLERLEYQCCRRAYPSTLHAKIEVPMIFFVCLYFSWSDMPLQGMAN